MRQVDYIVIHCTATIPEATVQGILNYWRDEKGWNNPGYHILIDKYGKQYELQSFDKIANGVKGFNHNSIHISYIGGIDSEGNPEDTRTTAQRAAIYEAIRKAIDYAGYVRILGHRDFPGVTKSCPSFDAKEEYRWITV